MKQQRVTTAAVIGTSAIAFVVYWLTLAPDLTWENFGGDGGELITAAFTWGVPHPPGYPTYVLLGKLFSYLPFGTVAYRFNLFSAICMAVAVGFVTKTAVSLINRTRKNAEERGLFDDLCAVAVGLTFAFAPLVWSQATITEVYALNMAVLAALMWAVVEKRPSFLIGLLFGLSITTHLTSLFFAPLVFLSIPKSQLKSLLAGVLLGITPYFLIFAFANSGSPVVWGHAGTLSGWWWLVSGQAYRGYAFGLPTNQMGSRLVSWGWALFNQFSLLGVPLVIWGGWRFYKQNRHRLLVGVGITAVFYIIYAATYNTKDAIILLLPALLLAAIFLTPSLHSLGQIAVLLPLSLLLLNFSSQNLQQNDLRSRVSEQLTLFPEDAIIITPGDTTIFTLWYFQKIESLRPDLVLVDGDLFAFDWYRQQLKESYPELEALNRDNLDAFESINGDLKPICHASLAIDMPVTPCQTRESSMLPTDFLQITRVATGK